MPIVPIISVTAIVGGAIAIPWYSSLSPEQQKAVDHKVAEIAFQLFRAVMPVLLSLPQLKLVGELAKAAVDDRATKNS
jgi:hypothetical protein